MTRDLPELLLLRHGETSWNREGRLQGGLDSDLTDLGRAQAAAMGGTLAALGVGLGTHAARTSPQGRARATARIALGPLGIVAEPDPRLAEIGLGGWAGLTRDEIRSGWAGPAAEPLFAFYARAPGGEGIAALAARAQAVLDGLGGPTILVTHGITLRVLCALATGRPAEEGEGFEMRQGSVVRVLAGRMERIDARDAGGAGLPAPSVAVSPPAGGG